MKKIYRIGTKQDFTYKNSKLHKLIFEFKDGDYYVVRNVKYIYANNREEAKEKYEKWFFRKDEYITVGWGDWYMWSDGADCMMSEKCINITSTKIVSINEDEDVNVNIETLKKSMQAENFKEWWFDDRSIKE